MSAARCATVSTSQEIAEVLIHTAVYAGVPAANTAFAIAQRVLEEEGGALPDTRRRACRR